jgi:hypothetical protein
MVSVGNSTITSSNMTSIVNFNASDEDVGFDIMGQDT